MKTAYEIEGIKAKVITPDDGGHYFFGYYDIQPFDSTGRYHLVHKAPFEGRLPLEDEVCELGVIDLETGEFIKYAETKAWNFQQGALLRWHKDDDHILFNVREDGAFRCCILNIKTGEKKILPRAIADVTKDGKWGVCINFSRIYDFRPGYGYAGIPDPYYNEKAPVEDGVFLMDMETGESKQILDYVTMRDAFPRPPFSDGKLLVNHINFNPSGTRFVMLFRNFREGAAIWKSQLLTSDLEGNLHCMATYSVQSHYNWKNDDELLIFGNNNDEVNHYGLYLFKDLSDEVTLLPDPNPEMDVHCLYSPNKRYIIGDDYPEKDLYRGVHLIDTEKNTETIIGRYFTETIDESQGICVDARCDLHGRFDRTGRYYSFDSIHTGKRTVCIIDLSNLEGYEY